LAQFAQDAQESNNNPYLASEDLEQMQQLTTKMDSYIRDLRYQVEANPFQSHHRRSTTEVQNAIMNRRERPANIRRNSSPAHRARRDNRDLWESTRNNNINTSSMNGSSMNGNGNAAAAGLDSKYGGLMQRINGMPFATQYPNAKETSPYPHTHPHQQAQHHHHSQHQPHEARESFQLSTSSQRSPSSTDETASSSLADILTRPSKYRKRSRAAAPESCLSCGAEDTPEWRRGPGGVRTLCNACGLHYSKMLRKRKNNNDGRINSGEVVVSIEELRASVLEPNIANNISEG